MTTMRWPALAGWRVILFAAAAGICWLAFTPNPPPIGDGVWDKFQHLFAFGVLSLLAHRAYPRASVAAHIGGLLAFGIFIELVQSQIPQRSAEVADVLADLCGVLLVLIVLRLRKWLTS
jgi:VanZ family protein